MTTLDSTAQDISSPADSAATEVADPKVSKLHQWVDHNRKRALIAFGVVSLLLAVANIAFGSPDQASQEPDDQVFDTRAMIDDRLPRVSHVQPIIVESADGGDVLRAAPLAELLTNANEVRATDAAGGLVPEGIDPQPLLHERWDPIARARVSGFTTLADIVDNQLMATTGAGLAAATDDQVKVALSDILQDPGAAPLREQLSQLATESTETVGGREITVHRSPALVFNVFADNAALGGGQFLAGPSSDPIIHTKEDFNLNVQDGLRGEQNNIEVLAIAAAANETSEAQGRTAAPFIVLAVVAAVLIVGIALRSYWAAALTGAGLAIQMSWLGGISDLLGLKGGLVIELLVPISMIALGVDFAVHAMAHTRHERRGPLAITGILSALALAAATDSAAFLSNATSDIEAIVHFGIAAAVATLSSFLILGVVAPLLFHHITESLGTNANKIGRLRFSPQIGTVIAAGMAGAASIVTLAVSPIAGAVLTLVLIGVRIVVPWRFVQRTHGTETASHSPHAAQTQLDQSDASARLSNLAGAFAARPAVVLVAAAALTAGAAFGASQLESSFEISDFFSADTDFVQSVNRVPQHLGESGGEPNQIVVSGDLTNPDSWNGLTAFVDSLDDNNAIAITAEGSVALAEPQPVAVLSSIVDSPDAVQDRTGITITDVDQNGVPDTAEQLAAVWNDALENGVTTATGQSQFSPADIASVIAFDGGDDVLLLQVEVPDPTNLENASRAGSQIADDAVPLQALDSISEVATTGSGLGRQAIIDASTNALVTALPAAVVAVFLVLLVGLRSLRYAIVTTVPMLLVACWLYGVMKLLDADINFVTATVGAISIGIGADYAIHMTDRYRRERSAGFDHVEATRNAASRTGVALATSAISTAVAFGILALAPMPLFATFGLLSALMVIFAFIASVFVLPTLLRFAHR